MNEKEFFKKINIEPDICWLGTISEDWKSILKQTKVIARDNPEKLKTYLKGLFEEPVPTIDEYINQFKEVLPTITANHRDALEELAFNRFCGGGNANKMDYRIVGSGGKTWYHVYYGTGNLRCVGDTKKQALLSLISELIDKNVITVKEVRAVFKTK
jgi:hypothetical protein